MSDPTEERKYDEVEKYFGVTYEEVGYGTREYNIMIRIQTDYENGTMGKDISYYAAMYGF